MYIIFPSIWIIYGGEGIKELWFYEKSKLHHSFTTGVNSCKDLLVEFNSQMSFYAVAPCFNYEFILINPTFITITSLSSGCGGTECRACLSKRAAYSSSFPSASLRRDLSSSSWCRRDSSADRDRDNSALNYRLLWMHWKSKVHLHRPEALRLDSQSAPHC